jgi:hypothetical protein
MSGRLISTFKRFYPGFVAGTTIGGGIASNIYYFDYINKNDVNFNKIDITIDGMMGGFLFGVISPIAIPYIGIATIYDMIVDKDYEP